MALPADVLSVPPAALADPDPAPVPPVGAIVTVALVAVPVAEAAPGCARAVAAAVGLYAVPRPAAKFAVPKIFCELVTAVPLEDAKFAET
jgi:hypothetical protein